MDMKQVWMDELERYRVFSILLTEFFVLNNINPVGAKKNLLLFLYGMAIDGQSPEKDMEYYIDFFDTMLGDLEEPEDSIEQFSDDVEL